MAQRRNLRSMSDDDMIDPYQLDDPSHNPDAFYVYCGKESTSTTGRVPTEYLNIISAFIARREVPEYQTAWDFVRDAIHHRIYWLQNHYDRPDIRDQINVFTQMERSIERQKALKARRQIVVQFRDEFNDAAKERSRGACQAVLDEVRLALDSRDATDDTYRRELESLAREFDAGLKGML